MISETYNHEADIALDVNGEHHTICEGDRVRVYNLPHHDTFETTVIKVIPRTCGAVPNGPYYCDDYIVVRRNPMYPGDLSEVAYHFKQVRKLTSKGVEIF